MGALNSQKQEFGPTLQAMIYQKRSSVDGLLHPPGFFGTGSLQGAAWPILERIRSDQHRRLFGPVAKRKGDSRELMLHVEQSK
jgi:hypothetical protein